MSKLLTELFAPVTDTEGVGKTTALDTLDLLGQEDEPKTDPEEKIDLLESDEKDTEKEVKETDKKEKDEVKEEEEPLKDDELDLISPVRRQAILAKYPTLFKDFPYLEKAYYREQKYSELFPTLDDATQASENAELLLDYGKQLSKGDIKGIFKDVKEANPEGFSHLVDNLLPQLHETDPQAYYAVTEQVLKHALFTAAHAGKNNKDEDLVTAAQLLYKFIWGEAEVKPATKFAKRPPQESDPHDEREQQFAEKQYSIHFNEVEGDVTRTIRSTIDYNIDPKETMPVAMRKYASKEVYEELEKQISNDRRFMSVLDRLWANAKDDDYSQESLDRIKQAAKSKAKTLLPDIIKKTRNEALKGLGRKVQDDDDETSSRKGPLPVGQVRRSTSQFSGNKTEKDRAREIPRGMSTLDFLNKD